MVNIKITAGIMFLFMLSGILWLFIGQKKLKTKEKLDHMIAAILSAIFGPIGDVWSRCAFYNGALEITNLKHSCWSFLVVLPLISNILGFWVHMGGLISDVPKKPCIDNWAIILLFLPVFLNYSMKIGGGKGVAHDKKIVLMTCVLFMALILARIYRKTTVCSRIIKEEDSKFTVSYATDEALNGMLFVNLLLLFMIMFCKMAGYPDIDGDIRESINVSGANQLRLNLWQKMSQQSKRYSGDLSNIFLKILKYMFGPALMMIFVCEFILPGIFHGLLLSSFHLIQNAKMNTDDDYLKEFCTETRDIDPINFTPKFTFAYNKPWKWIGFFKFLGALVLGSTAKIIIPKMTNVKSESWFYIGGGAMFMFLVMFVMMKMTTAKAKRKLKD
tara:strand:- start:1528 stop:2688 length:1161 start_codon:yes stop_codon:yes gene_type:complete